MAKVKQPAVLKTAKRGAKPASPTTRSSAKMTAPKHERAARPAAHRNGRKPSAVRAKPSPPVEEVVRIRELDPREKCGPGTTVRQLFRVDGRSNGFAQVHLVFHDRHGLYCEHGPGCYVVDAVRKNGMVRMNSVGRGTQQQVDRR